MRAVSIERVQQAKVSADPFHVQRRGFTMNKSRMLLWIMWCALCAMKLCACAGKPFTASESVGGSNGLAGSPVVVLGGAGEPAGDAGAGGDAGAAGAGTDGGAGAAGGMAGTDSQPEPSGGTGGTAVASAGAGGAAAGSGGGAAPLCQVEGWRGSSCDTCSAVPEAPGQSCGEILDCYTAHHCGPGCSDCEYQKPTSDQTVKVARAVYACRCPEHP